MAIMNQELSTETHLSKHYNYNLYMWMATASNAEYVVKATPHYDFLQNYYAAVDTLFTNTFFLFNNVKYLEKSLTLSLQQKMDEIEEMMKHLIYYPQYRNRMTFDTIASKCKLVHRLIMYGLQQRNMLVRMSEKEPRGIESIEYWDKKTMFKKGALAFKKDEDGTWVL